MNMLVGKLGIFVFYESATWLVRSLLTTHRDDTKFRAIWKLHAIYGMQQKGCPSKTQNRKR
jgi:hypothetical protein